MTVFGEDTTSQFFERREKELVAQISALRGQLGPKEAELSQIQRMKASLTIADDNSNALAQLGVSVPGYTNALARFIGGPPIPPYASMTIKELTVQALLDHFPNGGTAAEIRDFIRDAYNRVIEPSSLRPQMHRLKGDSKLEHDPATDTWNLSPTARRNYSMYDHPTSRRAMRELQDEPPTITARSDD